MKYYYVSYAYRYKSTSTDQASYEEHGILVNEHPVAWVIRANRERSAKFVIRFFAEVPEADASGLGRLS